MHTRLVSAAPTTGRGSALFTFECLQQLAQQPSESLLLMCSERCQQSALVLEVLGSSPIDERPALAGELDEQPPSVAGIGDALHEPAALEPREPLSHC